MITQEPEYLTVKQGGDVYDIYMDGVIYHPECTQCNNDDPECEHDIPELIFKLRDVIVKNERGSDES